MFYLHSGIWHDCTDQETQERRKYKDVLLQMCENNASQFEGWGNVVVFVLSEHCVSSWFSMLVKKEWGLEGRGATLAEAFPSRWVLRRTPRPKILSSVYGDDETSSLFNFDFRSG